MILTLQTSQDQLTICQNEIIPFDFFSQAYGGAPQYAGTPQYGGSPQYGGVPYGQQPYPQQGAVTSQPVMYIAPGPLSNPVNDYLGYSIFTMICCCLPLGIAALIYSIQVSLICESGVGSASQVVGFDP